MKRQVSYKWRLREVMAAAGMFAATDLEPHLHDRGVTLSSVQVWRLVTQTPERLSLPVLAALCDIATFFCDRCGFEGHLHTGRLCTRCTLSDQLHQALDDGSGRVHPPLAPLMAAVVAMPEPKNGLSWRRGRSAPDRVRRRPRDSER